MKYTVFYAKTFRGFHFGPTPKMVFGGDYDKVAEVETENLETLYREMNVVDGTELPVTLKVRSMSVGDVAVDETGAAHFCANVGWEPVRFEKES